jgi:tRNA(adenine34) deaminase
MSADERWMEIALAEAALAPEHADVPIGCVIVSRDGVELSRARNRRELDGDPTAHAEIVALREAARKLGVWRVEGATAYVTLEPCAMCAGAFVNARIARLVYGASDPKAGAVHSLFGIGSDRRLNHRYDAVAGVLAERAAAELRAFFAQLRAQGQR